MARTLVDESWHKFCGLMIQQNAKHKRCVLIHRCFHFTTLIYKLPIQEHKTTKSIFWQSCHLQNTYHRSMDSTDPAKYKHQQSEYFQAVGNLKLSFKQSGSYCCKLWPKCLSHQRSSALVIVTVEIVDTIALLETYCSPMGKNSADRAISHNYHISSIYLYNPPLQTWLSTWCCWLALSFGLMQLIRSQCISGIEDPAIVGNTVLKMQQT